MKTSNPPAAETRISRRRFLAASAVVSAAAVVPRPVLGAGPRDSPSEKLNIAGIGIGGMGAANLENLKSQNIVALCDVDHNYAAIHSKSSQAPACGPTTEKCVEKQKDIEAVMIATPDHTHAVIAMAALKAGKHGTAKSR
jgi:hypothetical protein